jgi:hypothetical protein
VKKNIFKTIFPLLLSGLFLSCINVDTEIVFRQDLSGEIMIKYSVSKSVLNIGILDENGSFLPLPVEEQKYREKGENTDGLELKSFKKEETEEELYITARYEFKTPEALNAAVSNSGERKIDVQRRSGSTYFTQNIFNKTNTPANEETLKLAEALFADRSIKMKVTAPSSIKRSNIGTSAGNSAEAVFNLPKLLSENTPVIWEVVW